MLLWVWLNMEQGCERKSVGSRGVEPCHPVVGGHTCLLFHRDCEELTGEAVLVYSD